MPRNLVFWTWYVSLLETLLSRPCPPQFHHESATTHTDNGAFEWCPCTPLTYRHESFLYYGLVPGTEVKKG